MVVPQPGRPDREHTLSTTYALTVEGIAKPTTHESLVQAVEALWEILFALPLAPTEHEAYRYFLAERGADHARDFIVRDGRMVLEFGVAGTRHTAVIRPSA
ncbi:hypothetical protein ACFVHB_38460 [Kitasatospora sp. NPDC127111]|uniref:hypothetical protein n=1 Tax=Kitasatospora sp. NPDC127111 TaxID=3345363 RepID=UPI00363C605B